MIQARLYRGGEVVEVGDRDISKHVGDRECLLWVDVYDHVLRAVDQVDAHGNCWATRWTPTSRSSRTA